MPALSFDQIWEAVKTLTPRQQRRLRRLLDALRVMSRPRTADDEVTLLLLKDGLIRRLPRPLTEADIQAFREYTLIHVEGKPLSETIIEERR